MFSTWVRCSSGSRIAASSTAGSLRFSGLVTAAGLTPAYLADGQATVAPLAVLGRAEPEAAVNCTNAAITIAPLVMSVCPISRPSKDLSVLPLLFKAGRTIPAVTSNEGNLDVAGLSHFEGLA
jgi:hypothetical protein